MLRRRERDHLEPPADPAVAAAGPPRLAGRRARRPPRGVGPHVRRDVDRLRELGYPVESLTGPAGGYRLRAGTAMPPLLLDDDEAIAIAVGLRTAARASVTGIEETVGARAGQARAGAALAPAPARPGAAVGDADARARRRPDRRPAGADADRRRVPRPRARCASATAARDGAETPPRGRAALARQRRPPLVPRRLGLRPRGLAHVPRRPPRRARRDRRALPAARAAGQGRAPRTSPQSLSARPNRYEARSRCTRRPSAMRKRLPRYGGADRAARARTAASTAPATTTSTGWRCGSRCSASTSRSTSRPS